MKWRILAALGVTVLLAWLVSISMLLSYLWHGPANVWDQQLQVIGDLIMRLLPPAWNGSADAAMEHLKLRAILTALALNTLQLALVGLLMAWAVRASLRPLAHTARELGRRDSFDPQPVAVAGVPAEIRPLIVAFNGLLGRVETALQAERSFIADAAHELRTPLSALQTHAENALRAPTVEQKDAALAKLLEVSRRSNRLAEQLLDLARVDAGLHVLARERTDLRRLAAHVVSEFQVEAERRGIDLVLAGEPCELECDIDEIGVLLRNLIDNALRHGRGRVEVHCGYDLRSAGRPPLLEVRDDGAGVPAEEREAIFQRFYRVPGGHARGSGHRPVAG
ncbi:two-component sensor histidine kinase, partial [Xanthomonas sp. Kuri4-1]